LDIGRRIRDKRKELNLTQEEVARRAGINLKIVGLLERGETQDPHVSNLQSIARALGMSAGELLGEDSASPKVLARR
jgi:transcriptional regulator with XRE-family HTH domain